MTNTTMLIRYLTHVISDFFIKSNAATLWNRNVKVNASQCIATLRTETKWWNYTECKYLFFRIKVLKSVVVLCLVCPEVATICNTVHEKPCRRINEWLCKSHVCMFCIENCKPWCWQYRLNTHLPLWTVLKPKQQHIIQDILFCIWHSKESMRIKSKDDIRIKSS